MRDKRQLTQALIERLPADQQESLDRAMTTWWYNIRKNGGMRLSEIGYRVLKHQLDIECYDIDVDPLRFDRRLLLKLDRKLASPYYFQIDKRKLIRIVMFGSREAMMARLYGDIEKFLEHY